jgi:hypothetical protein
MSITNNLIPTFNGNRLLAEQKNLSNPCNWQLTALVITSVALTIIAFIIKAALASNPLGMIAFTVCIGISATLMLIALIKGLMQLCCCRSNSASLQKEHVSFPAAGRANSNGICCCYGEDEDGSRGRGGGARGGWGSPTPSGNGNAAPSHHNKGGWGNPNPNHHSRQKKDWGQ